MADHDAAMAADVVNSLFDLDSARHALSETVVRAAPRFGAAKAKDDEDNEEFLDRVSGFMGGVDDNDKRMLMFVGELASIAAKVKAETKQRERNMPVIDEPFQATFPMYSSVACCRFHDWGVQESREYYERYVAPLIDPRDKTWHVYRFDIVMPGSTPVAWFVSASDHMSEDIPSLVTYIITGEAKRRIQDAEGCSEFSKYVLFIQTGHTCYRRCGNLEFLKLNILPSESNALNNSNRLPSDVAQWEFAAIENSRSWFTPKSVSLGSGGLNYWNPVSNTIKATWGVSLMYLRGILGESLRLYKNKSVKEVYTDVLAPKAQGFSSFMDFMKHNHPQHVHERVDWFVSPACHDCNWVKMVHEGGISIFSKDPVPLQKGNRYVYIDLLH